MSGYWRAPDLTEAAITPDGFVRTGDLGWIDDAGRLRLVGRSKEMYVRGGYNVYPMEVEGVLAGHPAIADIAIAPRPDDVMGEVGVAVVVAREGHAPPALDELRSFAEDRLARYKMPESVMIVDALPLTAMEKLDRKALAALVDNR
jgi:acyl-CoA synthetase (AMP-forming)/AMP-acid ligase II